MKSGLFNPNFDWKTKLRDARVAYDLGLYDELSTNWEALRSDYVDNPFYTGMDLDFKSLMEMRGMTPAEFESFNAISIDLTQPKAL